MTGVRGERPVPIPSSSASVSVRQIFGRIENPESTLVKHNDDVKRALATTQYAVLESPAGAVTGNRWQSNQLGTGAHGPRQARTCPLRYVRHPLALPEPSLPTHRGRHQHGVQLPRTPPVLDRQQQVGTQPRPGSILSRNHRARFGHFCFQRLGAGGRELLGGSAEFGAEPRHEPAKRRYISSNRRHETRLRGCWFRGAALRNKNRTFKARAPHSAPRDGHPECAPLQATRPLANGATPRCRYPPTGGTACFERL